MPRWWVGRKGGAVAPPFRFPPIETENAILLTHVKLEQMQSVNINAVDKASLSDVIRLELDNSLPKVEHGQDFEDREKSLLLSLW